MDTLGKDGTETKQEASLFPDAAPALAPRDLAPDVAARVVQVLVPVPTGDAYSYLAPEGAALEPGAIVTVPFGPRRMVGCVWEGDAAAIDPGKLREIETVHDCPPLAEEMRRFVDWVARYTLSTPGMVLRMVLRTPGALDPERPRDMLRLREDRPEIERSTTARRKVLDAAGAKLWTKALLAGEAGVSSSVVDGLVKLDQFETVTVAPEPAVARPDPLHAVATLNDEQQEAADAMSAMIEEGGFQPALLDGITGSGKTETYFEAVATALRAAPDHPDGGQVLILLPEIALTASFLARFEKRFGARPAEWHSDIAPRQRERVWRGVATGEVRVVVGARSALFLPFRNLRLLVVDEEHEAAYKQEDRVFYNARDMAVVRAKLGGHAIVLASATPSLESRINAEAGRYRLLKLTQRWSDAILPELAVIDMRKHPPARGKFIAPPLVEHIAANLEKGEQSLLFLNRRGYAPLTLCRVCGHRFECDQCSAWLVEHRFRRVLQCHHCGNGQRVPEACPSCGALDHLVACGPGVERIAEEVVDTFPQARTMILSSDMQGGTARLRAELEAIREGEVDIVIGTQLVAKGHNFPAMTFVGVVDADLGLANGDPRAAERTFQLLAQVTGRAGRAGGRSVGLLQSYAPEHPVIQAIAAGDSDAFYEREAEARRFHGLPPYGRLAAIICSGTDKGEVEAFARAVRLAAPPRDDIVVFGPAEAPLLLVRGRFRYRLLVHARRSADLQGFLRAWLAEAPPERGSLRAQVDVDPQTFL